MLKAQKTENPLSSLEATRKSFVNKASTFRSNNAYIAFIKEDLSLYTQGAGPCHGGWKNHNNSIKPFYALSSVQGHDRNESLEKDFYTFLANESVFKDVFVTKDYYDIMKNGWVFNCDLPQNVVGNAAVATRFYTECYNHSLKHRHPIYLVLREMGLGPWESYFFSHMFSPQGSRLFPCTVSLFSSGHTIFNTQNASKEALRNMLNARFDPARIDPVSFKDNKGYTPGTLDYIWGAFGGENSYAQSKILGLKPREAIKKINLNIFEKAPPTGYAIKDKEGLMDVIAQMKEFLNNA